MVWPSHVRRRPRKHAFEEALEQTQLDGDGQPVLAEDEGPRVTGPAVSGLGGLAVANGYVAQSSLDRAYSADASNTEEEPVERPSEAARRLKQLLASRSHTPRELGRLRRSFAAANHPDRVEAELRAEAVAAMAEANAAIDRALQGLKGAGAR